MTIPDIHRLSRLPHWWKGKGFYVKAGKRWIQVNAIMKGNVPYEQNRNAAKGWVRNDSIRWIDLDNVEAFV